ncbi:MAG: hypothetical protein QOD60_2533, partial [Solirubrobacterales bacterium]|nr:hypothetical protein [Solirubrobacterales bacterium]
MPDIVMPRLSDSMEEGTVLKWLKSVGDEVAVGDELVEIETDKANMVYESDSAGTLSEIVAGEGDTLPIGEVIARVGDAGAPASGNGGEPVAAPAPPLSPSTEQKGMAAEEGSADARSGGRGGAVAEPAPPRSEPSRTADGGRIKASPIARRIAEERGLDLAALSGSGPGGRIVKADVEKAGTGAGSAGPAPAPAAAAAPAAPTPGAQEKPETAKGQTTVQELTKLQQIVARRMSESKATAPHFYLSANVDMTRCFEARAGLKATAKADEPVPS